MLKMDGLDPACIGSVELKDGKHLVYSTQSIIDILIQRDGMSEDEAVEFFDFNIDRGVTYLGDDPHRPILLIDRDAHESVDDFAERLEEWEIEEDEQ